jgi:hypothetical protein
LVLSCIIPDNYNVISSLSLHRLCSCLVGLQVGRTTMRSRSGCVRVCGTW